jgi:O-antigen ligase
MKKDIKNMSSVERELESKYMIFIIFFLSIYIFFGYLFPKNITYIVLAIIFLGMLFNLTVNKCSVNQKQLPLMILIIIFMLLEFIIGTYSLFPESSIKVTITRNTILGIGMLFSLQGKWYKQGIKILLICSLIHSLLTVFSYFYPLIFQETILSLITNFKQLDISQFTNKKLYAGITDQIGRNAFYISVGISIIFCELILKNKKQNILNYVILGILIFSLLLTGKRGQLVANFFSILFITSIYTRVQGKKVFIHLLKILTFLIISLCLIIWLFPEAAAPFLRFIERIGGDQTSGRLVLYKYAVDMFYEKPILGWGAGVFANLYGKGNHNLYLQLLSENGLIGFCIFSFILLLNFYYTLKFLSRKSINQNNCNLKYGLFSLYIQVFYLIYGLTGNPLNDGFILITYFVASSIPYSFYRKNSTYFN